MGEQEEDLQFLECMVGDALAETGNVCCLITKSGFYERLVIIKMGREESGLPGKAQKMERKGGAQVVGQLDPEAVATCDRIRRFVSWGGQAAGTNSLVSTQSSCLYEDTPLRGGHRENRAGLTIIFLKRRLRPRWQKNGTCAQVLVPRTCNCYLVCYLQKGW